MEQKINIEFSIQQLNVVLAGLVKLPIEVGLDAFNSVQQQANSQLGQPSKIEGPLSDKVDN